jgi:hypothetical protein
MAVAHQSGSEQTAALRTLQRLLEEGARSPGWDFSRNIARARSDGHPDADWLEPLAAVVNDTAGLSTLEAWARWRALDEGIARPA